MRSPSSVWAARTSARSATGSSARYMFRRRALTDLVTFGCPTARSKGVAGAW